MTTQIKIANHLRPLLLLGYADSAYAARVSRYFRRHGWEVHLVTSGMEVRRLVRFLTPAAVVLEVDLPGESGWLTAAKLRLDQPAQQILLVGDGLPENHRFAAFIGASRLLTHRDGPAALFDAILGDTRSATVA